ncbi:MAG: class I SAM-dependent methyltransferase, partial [Candidatus Poseidoniia archaeon]|nr:class I SAM-dependent methyltransferase [Candidatus Poseidoniia archaeon]
MKDEANLTFSHTVESVSSPEAMAFQREKFTPRIDRLAAALEKPLVDAVVLDIGIGYGSFLQILEHDYGVNQVFGMDPFPKSLELARQNTGADLRKGDIDERQWPFALGQFDAITCYDVIEHLTVPAMFFVRARRYLQDGGLLLATTPNKLLPYHMRKLPL